MALTLRYCSLCGDEQIFEQPPCADGHVDDCPEWVCVECGAAVMIGTSSAPPTRRRTSAA